MGKADRAKPSTRASAVVDASLPAGDRKRLRAILQEIEEYRARRAKRPPDRYRRDDEIDLPSRLQPYEPHNLEDMATSKNAWLRALVGVGGLTTFMVAHHTLNPFGIWLTPDLSGPAKMLGWLHDAAAITVLLMLLSVVVQLAWAIRRQARGAYVSPDEELYWASKGRYITPDELDAPARKLLGRAQRAIRTVLSSTIHEVGLLDRVHNEVLLPTVEWELAKTLRHSTKVRASHPELEQAGRAHDDAGAAYAKAHQVMSDRVAALERYAERVLAADIAYQIAGGDDGYVMAELEGLTNQAGAAERAFRQSLERVHEVAAVLGTVEKP